MGALVRQRKFSMRRGMLWVIVLYSILALGVIISIFPFYLMISGSFKENYETITLELQEHLLPENIDLRKYNQLFREFPFGKNLFNSFFVATCNTVLVVFFCSLAGFTFAKYPFPGKNGLFLALLATMMMPLHVLVVPTYILIRKIGWLNTYYALIFPEAAPAFGVFLMRQYVAGAIPNEILEAARIDGCTETQIFFRIALPCLRPGLVVLALLTLMLRYNEFLWPFVTMSHKDMYTTTLVIQALADPGGAADWGTVFAASTLTALPLFSIFLLFQKKMISGIMSGFMKG